MASLREYVMSCQLCKTQFILFKIIRYIIDISVANVSNSIAFNPKNVADIFEQ